MNPLKPEKYSSLPFSLSRFPTNHGLCTMSFSYLRVPMFLPQAVLETAKKQKQKQVKFKMVLSKTEAK